jgi:hypothetical protein
MNKCHWKKKRIFLKSSGWAASAAIWRKTLPFWQQYRDKLTCGGWSSVSGSFMIYTIFKDQAGDTGGGCAPKIE